VSKEGTN